MFQIKYQDKVCKIPTCLVETDPILEQIGFIFGVNNQDFILFYNNIFLSRRANYNLLEIGYNPYEILEVINLTKKDSYFNVLGNDYCIQVDQFSRVYTIKQYFSLQFFTVPQNIIIKYNNSILSDSETMIKFESSKDHPFQISVKDNYFLVRTYLSNYYFVCLGYDSTVKNLKETISIYSQEGNSITSLCTYSPKMKEICKQNDLKHESDIDNMKLQELLNVMPLFEFVYPNPEIEPDKMYKITVNIKDYKYDKCFTREYQVSCRINLYTLTVLLEKDLRIDRSLFVPFNKNGDKIDLTETVSQSQKNVLFKISEELYVKVGMGIQQLSYLTTIRDLRVMNDFETNHFGTIINNHFAYYDPNDQYLLIHFMNNEKDPQKTTLITYQRSKEPCKFMTFTKVEENLRVKMHFIIPNKMKEPQIAQIYLHQNINSITFLHKSKDEITYKLSDTQKIKYKLIDLKGETHISEIEMKGQNLRIIDLLLSIYNQENRINSIFRKLMKKYDALPKFNGRELKFWEPLSKIYSDDSNMITIEGYKGNSQITLYNLINNSTNFYTIPFKERLKAHEIISSYCKKNKIFEIEMFLRLYSDFNMLRPNDIPSLLKPRYNILILNRVADRKKLILNNTTKFQCEFEIERKNFDKCADIIKEMFNLPEGELTFSGILNGIKFISLEQTFDAGCFPDNSEILLRYKYKNLHQMTFRYGGKTKVLKINVNKPIILIIPAIQKEFNLWNYSRNAIRLSFLSFEFQHDQSFSYYKFPQTAAITISTKDDAFPLQIAKLGSEEFNSYYFVNGEKIEDLIDHFRNQYNSDIYPYKNSDGKIQIGITKGLEKNMRLYISSELKTVKCEGSLGYDEIGLNSIPTVTEASKFLNENLSENLFIFTKNNDDGSYEPAIENELLFELKGQLFAHKFFSNIEFNYTIFNKSQHISELNTVKWLKEKCISELLLISVDDFIIKKNNKKLDNSVKIGEVLKNFDGKLEIFIETGINRKLANKRKLVTKFKPIIVPTGSSDALFATTIIAKKEFIPQKEKVKSDDDSDEGSDKQEDFSKMQRIKSPSFAPKKKELKKEGSDYESSDEQDRRREEQKIKARPSHVQKKKVIKKSSDDESSDEKVAYKIQIGRKPVRTISLKKNATIKDDDKPEKQNVVDTKIGKQINEHKSSDYIIIDHEVQIELSNYTLHERVGNGSYGEVCKIKDNKTGELYAAKILYKPISETRKSEKKNLYRELNIMAKINHPNIVKFIGFSPINFHKEDKPVIITELVSEGSLLSILEKERSGLAPDLWDDTHKLISIYCIASAMSFLHSHGIIHRDLKPANILMNGELYPKVADFGLSKIINKEETDSFSDSSSGLMGTPIYMAPESIVSHVYTNACDVYAYGMILYEIVTGEVPFKGFYTYQILTQVPAGFRPKFSGSVPKVFKDLIEDCWNQEPEKRPTFEVIVDRLKNNPEFITGTADKDDYFNYIDYVEEFEIKYNKNRKIISLK